MAIKRRLSGLPSDDGFEPDVDDTWGKEMVRRWLDHVDPDVPLAVAIPEAGPMRASFATRCARSISYDISDLPQPATALKDRWRFMLGTMIHEQLFKHAQVEGRIDVEVSVSLEPIGVPGSAHADAIEYNNNGEPLRVFELKTVNGTGFKQMATNERGPTQGPRLSYLMQAGLTALAIGAPEIVIMVTSLENAADWHLNRYATERVDLEAAPFYAQWTIQTEDLREEIEREAERLSVIAKMHNDGKLAPRAIIDSDVPNNAMVDDPATGSWSLKDRAGEIVAAGNTWQCGYCDWRDQCIKDGA